MIRILNFIIPLAYVFGLSIGFIIYAGFAYFLSFANADKKLATDIGGWLALFTVLALAYAVVRRQVDLGAPHTRKTVVGHLMLTLANAAAISTTVVPVFLEQFAGKTNFGLYMWYFLPVLLINVILWPWGWQLATSSGPKRAQNSARNRPLR